MAQIQAAHDGSSDDEKGLISFKTNDGNDSNSPTERWRITSDGHFKAMVDGYGIDFSAVEGSVSGTSVSSSILDDYEAGTWTPTLNFNTGASSVAYSERKGTYTKVGRLVTIMGVIVLTSKGSGGSGRVQITGVPFNCSTATGILNQYTGSVEARFVTLSSEAIHAEIGRSSASMVRIMRSQSGGQVVEIIEANCANNTGFLFTITYEEA